MAYWPEDALDAPPGRLEGLWTDQPPSYSMTSRQRHLLLLWSAATDRTFDWIEPQGRKALGGKCIHCKAPLVVELDPSRPSSATLEHIHPRHHGGLDRLDNLALACARCNAGKGTRLDVRPLQDADLQRVIAQLRARRQERWREGIEGLSLPPLPRSGEESEEAPQDTRRTRHARRGGKKLSFRRR